MPLLGCPSIRPSYRLLAGSYTKAGGDAPVERCRVRSRRREGTDVVDLDSVFEAEQVADVFFTGASAAWPRPRTRCGGGGTARWRGANPAEIREPAAWLTTVLARICLDVLRSARVRREAYVGTWLPEPLVARIPAPGAGGEAESAARPTSPSTPTR